MTAPVKQPVDRVYLAVWVVIFIVIGVPLSLIVYFKLDEVPIRHYANYEELVHSGLMERGVLLKTIPKFMREMKMWHDVENDEVWASFYIAVEDVDELTAGFSEVIEGEREGFRIFTRDRNCGSCALTTERLFFDPTTGMVQYDYI